MSGFRADELDALLRRVRFGDSHDSLEAQKSIREQVGQLVGMLEPASVGSPLATAQRLLSIHFPHAPVDVRSRCAEELAGALGLFPQFSGPTS